jgi:5,10-methylenetetrahydromethanopterin reductase
MNTVREFGVAFESPSAKDYISAARLAEQLGFGTFWVPEDPVFPGAFATAAAIATNTKKIKVGIGVLNPWTRHPVQTAMELAALDDISEGRAVLGLGVSVKLWIEDQLGISYSRPATALRETIEIINQLFRGDQLSYDGKVFKALGVRATFRPQRPHVPIHLGVMAARTLALAGEVADGVLLNSVVDPVLIREACEQVRRGGEQGARNLDDFSFGSYVAMAMDSHDEQRAREVLKPYIAMLIAVFARQPQLPFLEHAGLTPAAGTRFAERLLSGDSADDMVTDAMVEKLAIAGSPERCREKLAAMIESGVTSPVLFFPPPIDFDRAARDVAAQLFSHFL